MMGLEDEDWKRLARLRKKYGSQKIPEPKEFSKEEIIEGSIKQLEVDNKAIEKAKEKDERLSRRYVKR